jgi:hypothetical protein
MKTRIPAVLLIVILASNAAQGAVCVNRFVGRSEKSFQIITLLTGKLTFQEAQALAKAIENQEAPPLEWVDDKGKVLARQFGELKVIRPMPVGCDGKSSGVVMIARFPSPSKPLKKMLVKLDGKTTVAFEQQEN